MVNWCNHSPPLAFPHLAPSPAIPRSRKSVTQPRCSKSWSFFLDAEFGFAINPVCEGISVRVLLTRLPAGFHFGTQSFRHDLAEALLCGKCQWSVAERSRKQATVIIRFLTSDLGLRRMVDLVKLFNHSRPLAFPHLAQSPAICHSRKFVTQPRCSKSPCLMCEGIREQVLLMRVRARFHFGTQSFRHNLAQAIIRSLTSDLGLRRMVNKFNLCNHSQPLACPHLQQSPSIHHLCEPVAHVARCGCSYGGSGCFDAEDTLPAQPKTLPQLVRSITRFSVKQCALEMSRFRKHVVGFKHRCLQLACCSSHGTRRQKPQMAPRSMCRRPGERQPQA